MIATSMKDETLMTPIQRVIEMTNIWRKMKINTDGRGPKIENINDSKDITRIPKSQKK